MAEVRSVHLRGSSPDFDITNNTTELTVYPRLHMFSLDLSAQNNGIRCGSMGTSVPTMPVGISVIRTAEADQYDDAYSGDMKVPRVLEALRTYLGRDDHWSVRLQYPDRLRAHTGLGTSTQVLGGVAVCAANSSGRRLSYEDLFALGFGHASTLGLSLLYEPGLMIEHGYAVTDAAHGQVLHPHMPSAPEKPYGSLLKIMQSPWYVTVGMPASGESLSGQLEQSFWNGLLPDDPNAARRTMGAVMGDIVPGLIADDFERFMHGMRIAADQPTKRAEEELQPPETKTALKVLRGALGFAAVSSLGPSIYSFSEHDPAATVDTLSSPNYTYHSFALSEPGGAA